MPGRAGMEDPVLAAQGAPRRGLWGPRGHVGRCSLLEATRLRPDGWTEASPGDACPAVQLNRCGLQGRRGRGVRWGPGLPWDFATPCLLKVPD